MGGLGPREVFILRYWPSSRQKETGSKTKCEKPKRKIEKVRVCVRRKKVLFERHSERFSHFLFYISNPNLIIPRESAPGSEKTRKGRKR